MQFRRLDEICQLKQWKTISNKQLVEKGYPVYGANGIIGYYTEYNHEKETILLGCRGSCGTVYISKPYSYINGNAMCLDNLSNEYLIVYVYYFLKSLDFSKIISGTGIPQITQNSLKNVRIPIINLQSQNIIAKELRQIIKLMQHYCAYKKSLSVLVKSRFIELFDIDNLPRKRIDEICKVFSDGDWIESKDQSKNGLWLIQTGNVGNGIFKPKADKKHFISLDTFKRLNCTEIFEGDILVSRLPDPVGRACIIPKLDERCITAVDCTIIRLEDYIDRKYFIIYASMDDYYSQLEITGSTRQRVSRKNLGKVMIPIPPVELQNEFASFVELIDKSKYFGGAFYV